MKCTRRFQTFVY